MEENPDTEFQPLHICALTQAYTLRTGTAIQKQSYDFVLLLLLSLFPTSPFSISFCLPKFLPVHSLFLLQEELYISLSHTHVARIFILVHWGCNE